MNHSDRIDRLMRKHNSLKTESVKRARVIRDELIFMNEKIAPISAEIIAMNKLLVEIKNCIIALFVLGVINAIALIVSFYG